MTDPPKLIPLHGAYRNLKSFQVAQPAYDVTARFCERYFEKRSRFLAALRDALLPKLLSGELPMPTPSRFGEAAG